MAKFKYVGPVEGEVKGYGCVFPEGEFVEIENEFLAGKAANNPDFESDDIIPDLDENGNADNVDLESLHYSKIKAMVEEKGGEYTNKAEGIAFLRGE